MKKLDKLFLQLFLRYLLLVLPVVVFVLLTQYLLKYFDEFVGKGISVGVYAQLMTYFSVNMIPMSLNLSVMVAALMTYGTLGEHSELTAIKASGISSLRLLRAVFFFVVGLSVVAFLANAYLIPRVNLKAFLLLHDIRHKKPAFNLQEKQFYAAIPGYSIRVEKRLPAGKLHGVMIYDHTEEDRHSKHRVILADSGRMYSPKHGDSLYIKLFHGHYYLENRSKLKENTWNDLIRSKFERMDIAFNLSSFQLKRSAEDYFSHLRYGKQLNRLFIERDSMQQQIDSLIRRNKEEIPMLHLLQGRYHGPEFVFPPPRNNITQALSPQRSFSKDKAEQLLPAAGVSYFSSESLLVRQKFKDRFMRPLPIEEPLFSSKKLPYAWDLSYAAVHARPRGVIYTDPLSVVKKDYVEAEADKRLTYATVAAAFWELWEQPFSQKAKRKALQQVEHIRNNLSYRGDNLKIRYKDLYKHELEAYKRYALAFSCIVMFLIGASIGGIIKKGGLGVPILIAICFFIIFHVTSMLTEKHAREGLLSTWAAAWAGGALLSLCAVFLLVLLARDARLWEWRK